MRIRMLTATIATLGLAAVSSGVAKAAPCAGFSDVTSSASVCADVAWIKNRGITQGCSPGAYCPDSTVTRAAMASFLTRLGKSLTVETLSRDSAGTITFVYGVERTSCEVTLATASYARSIRFHAWAQMRDNPSATLNRAYDMSVHVQPSTSSSPPPGDVAAFSPVVYAQGEAGTTVLTHVPAFGTTTIPAGASAKVVLYVGSSSPVASSYSCSLMVDSQAVEADVTAM